METFTSVLNKKLIELMQKNKKIICLGLGVNDPKKIFGTTKNLKKKFGIKRVFETPTSENCITGVGVGLAIRGFVPIMVHQRMDFFLLAFDQLINNAAKWNFMFNRKKFFFYIIRLIVGRGWGQGPTHSQSFHNLFANIPNIKVITPCFPEEASELLDQSSKISGPVIFLEHRWCHGLLSNKIKNKKKGKIKIGGSSVLKKGVDITIVSFSYSTIEVMKIYNILSKLKIKIEHINLHSLKPIDFKTIENSVKKTKKIIFFDNLSPPFCSIGDTVIAKLHENLKNKLIYSKNMTLPDKPNPTSKILSNNFYISQKNLVEEIIKGLNKNYDLKKIKFDLNKDVPDENFKGPF